MVWIVAATVALIGAGLIGRAWRRRPWSATSRRPYGGDDGPWPIRVDSEAGRDFRDADAGAGGGAANPAELSPGGGDFGGGGASGDWGDTGGGDSGSDGGGGDGGGD